MNTNTTTMDLPPNGHRRTNAQSQRHRNADRMHTRVLARIGRLLPRLTSQKASYASLVDGYEALAQQSAAMGDEQGAKHWQACAEAVRDATTGNQPQMAATTWEAKPENTKPTMKRQRSVLGRMPVAGLVLISLFFVFATAVPAFATEIPPISPSEPAGSGEMESRFERALSRSVVEIDTPAARGTGVYAQIGDQYVLITAEHVLRDGKMLLADSVRFRSYSADPSDASEWQSIMSVSQRGLVLPNMDVAIIVLNQPLVGLVAATIGLEPTEAGRPVVAFGFAAADGAILRGEVTGFDLNDEQFISLRLPVMPGDSGGPVFDAKTGMLIGIVSSQADEQMSNLYYCTPVLDQMACQWSMEHPPMNATALAANLVIVMQQAQE